MAAGGGAQRRDALVRPRTSAKLHAAPPGACAQAQATASSTPTTTISLAPTTRSASSSPGDRRPCQTGPPAERRPPLPTLGRAVHPVPLDRGPVRPATCVTFGQPPLPPDRHNTDAAAAARPVDEQARAQQPRRRHCRQGDAARCGRQVRHAGERR